MKKTNQGFTLIELIVVIAIIAVLTGLVSFNFQQARMKARDISRKSDLKQIANALEAYKSDNASYPANPSTALVPTYMKEYFRDPKEILQSGSWVDYSYVLGTDTLQYTLQACLENTGDPVRKTPVVTCGANNSGVIYELTQP